MEYFAEVTEINTRWSFSCPFLTNIGSCFQNKKFKMAPKKKGDKEKKISKTSGG